MEERNVIQKGNTLSMDLSLAADMFTHGRTTTRCSREYVLCGSVKFQLKVIISVTNEVKSLALIKFVKSHPDDDLIYTINVTSSALRADQCYTSDDGTWRLFYENCRRMPDEIGLKLQVNVVPSASSFSPLHEDSELLDFELRGEDGSVHFHKTVLAASSPVFRTMIGGTWKETTEDRVDVAGTSKKTLQHLKNYMYLHTFPDEDVEQLLLLSLFYMMPDLERRCVHSLITNLSAQNAYELLKFAVNHESKTLLFTVMKCVQNRDVNFQDMLNKLMHGDDGEKVASIDG